MLKLQTAGGVQIAVRFIIVGEIVDRELMLSTAWNRVMGMGQAPDVTIDQMIVMAFPHYHPLAS